MAVHMSGSIERGSCVEAFVRGAIESALKTQALAGICVENRILSKSSYAVSIVALNRNSSRTGNTSLDDDLKKALKVSRAVSLLGNSHVSCKSVGERTESETGEDSLMGMLKSTDVAIWPVLVEIH